MEDKPSWEELLKLLGMTNASFRDQEEMDLGYEFMLDLINQHGREWLKENKYHAMNQWEDHLDSHRKKKAKKKKKKRRGIFQPKSKGPGKRRRDGILGKLFHPKEQEQSE